MADEILFAVENGVALLRVNRPQARNALNWAAQEAFAAAVAAAAQDPVCRALIITGTGDQAFVAGGDLKELSRRPDTAAGRRLNQVMGTALAQLTELPFPVIAAINGGAFGGGCEIITACDLRIAAAHARFSFAQVKVGLTTGWGGGARLARLIGQSRALELLLTARLFDAPEAQQLGLVHRIAPDGEDVVSVARAWANDLAALPRQALAATKALVHASVHLSLHKAYERETEMFVELWPQVDHLEAMAAFVAKRKPTFQ